MFLYRHVMSTIFHYLGGTPGAYEQMAKFENVFWQTSHNANGVLATLCNCKNFCCYKLRAEIIRSKQLLQIIFYGKPINFHQ